MVVHKVKINGGTAPPPPPRPTGTRPRPRKVDPVSAGPAAASAAAAAKARMEGRPVENANDAVTQDIGGWMPETAMDIIAFYEQHLPGFFENLSQALGTLSDRSTADMPLDPSIGDHTGDMASAAQGMADSARELASILRQKHEAEIARVEEPRPAEEVWDVRD
jgi:hypothetical protein